MGRSFTLKHSFSRRAGQAYSASSEGIRRPQVVLIVSEGKERGEAAKPHPPTNIEVEDVTMEEGGEDEGAEGPSFRQLVEWDKGFGDVIQDVNVNVLRGIFSPTVLGIRGACRVLTLRIVLAGKLDNDEDDFDPNNTETVPSPRPSFVTLVAMCGTDVRSLLLGGNSAAQRMEDNPGELWTYACGFQCPGTDLAYATTSSSTLARTR
eukprot:2049920-Rhodomonas_salina.2